MNDIQSTSSRSRVYRGMIPVAVGIAIIVFYTPITAITFAYAFGIKDATWIFLFLFSLGDRPLAYGIFTSAITP